MYFRSKRAMVLRTKTGSSLLELPVSLWIILMVLFMPMLALASISLRCTLAGIAIQDAVHVAAKARTFLIASSEGPSAMQVGNTVFQNHMQAFSGINLSNFDLDIVATTIASQAPIRFETVLGLPADTSTFVYQVEGSGSAVIDPLFPCQLGELSQIPGLTAPMTITFSARQMVENPQGWNR